MSEPRFDALIDALADPTRRRIVEMLASGGEQRLSDLAGRFQMTRQAVAKHVDILRDAGLVRSEKRGRERLNSLAGDAFDPLADWLARHDHFWSDRLGGLKALIEEKEGGHDRDPQDD